MTKESRVLLVALLACTVALASLQLFLHKQAIGVSLLSGQSVNKAVQLASPSAVNALGKTDATPSASASATPAQKTASASATMRPRVTATPTATPEVTEEE